MISTIVKTAPATALEFLYGSDPEKNQALVRARSMSPDEFFSAGFRHGQAGSGMYGSMLTSIDYCAGYVAGQADRNADA